MIFLHNGGTDHSVWDSVSEYFAAQYRIYSLDWPGFGQSEGNQNSFNFEAYGNVLRDFIEQLNLVNITLVGNCIGSAASLNYCHRVQGVNIRSLVLFNVLSPSTVSDRAKIVIRYEKNPIFKAVTGWIETKLCQYALGRKVLIDLQFENPDQVSKESKQHLANLYENPKNYQNINSIGEAVASFAPIDTFEKTDWFPPIMMVWGKSNKALPYHKGQELMRHFKPDEELVLEGGHLVMLEDAKRVAHHIRRFLDI